MFNTLTRMGSSGAGAYEIERSIRFDSSDSVRLSRTFGTNSSNTTKTLSFWMKRGKLGTYQVPFSTTTDSYVEGKLRLNDDDTLQYEDRDSSSGSTDARLITTRKFRDISTWYHIVLTIDTTNGTAADRVRIYVNGERDTSSAHTNPASSYAVSFFRSSVDNWIGVESSSSNFFDGYLAEIYFIDGTALDATSFGETNDDTGQWVPKKYAGAYGTNGFFLEFKDNSGTGATQMGKDTSGNGNNWTPHNISVSGIHYVEEDSMVDTPTNNFPTFNPLWGRTGYLPELTNGNLDCHLPNGSYNQFAVGTMAMKSGKWYWEVTIEDSGTAGDDTKCLVGIGEPYAPWSSLEPVWKWRSYRRDGQKVVGVNDSNTTSAYGASFTDGDVIGVALDLDAGTLIMYKNGTSQGTLDSTVTSGMGANGWIPLVRGYASPNFNINFGQRIFAHTPPTGYQKLCSANLPEPTIKNGTDYFNTILWSGNNTNGRGITGVGFQPDLVWIKSRSHDPAHQLFDAVRGGSKVLQSNDSQAEQTNQAFGYLSAFNSDGFTLTEGTYTDYEMGNVNMTGRTYVGWNWKESATAGFDIVSYTGNGSNRTIAHSLGVVPEFILVKNRDVADSWQIYHHTVNATPEDYTAFLDQTNAFYDDIVWNDTKPTSSVFHLGVEDKVNANGEDFIAYLWSGVAGYSNVGIYTGNGNADGPFVYTGFKPVWILYKKSNASENWHILDNKRDTSNPNSVGLDANLTNAEASDANLQMDFLSNGFKLRTSHGTANGSDDKYVYLAFAESPFKYANAR